MWIGIFYEKQIEKSEEQGTEKHKPVINSEEVEVGSIPHPMEEEHHIMFIEAISPDKKYLKRKYLKPHEVPEMELKCIHNEVTARELCNLHGLWVSD